MRDGPYSKVLLLQIERNLEVLGRWCPCIGDECNEQVECSFCNGTEQDKEHCSFKQFSACITRLIDDIRLR